MVFVEANLVLLIMGATVIAFSTAIDSLVMNVLLICTSGSSFMAYIAI